MEATFTQHVQQLYALRKQEYEEGGKAMLFAAQRALVAQLALQGAISTYQLHVYSGLFDYLERLSFLEMVAYRAQVATRTVYRIMVETHPPLLDEWRTVAAILQAAGVDQNELWQLNLLYIFECVHGTPKRGKSTTTQSLQAVRLADQIGVSHPSTEPIGGFAIHPLITE